MFTCIGGRTGANVERKHCVANGVPAEGLSEEELSAVSPVFRCLRVRACVVGVLCVVYVCWGGCGCMGEVLILMDALHVL